MKIWLIVLVSVVTQPMLMAKPISISVVDQKDYDVLDQFLRMVFFEEEYGYVLEGLKPISVRNFMPIEEIHPYKDLRYAQKEFANTILAREAITAWKKLCAGGKNFALKAIPLRNTTTTGWEIQFINTAKLREVIEENISLFRYTLGPKIQADELVNQIAYSNQDFCSILQNDLVLVGIVLGYGIHNSLMGGRLETISSMTISKDCAPYLPKSQLMLSKQEHSMNVFIPQAFGMYYLSFAGGDDSHFRDDYGMLHPSIGASTVEEEVMAIDEMDDDTYPPQLMQKPGFVFSAYKGGSSNKPFFNRLMQAQKRIQSLLKRSDFLETVLEKIGGRKPIIACKKTNHQGHKIHANFSVHEWTRILQNAANRFEDQERQLAFFESYCHQTEACQVPPKMAGASKAILIGLKKAHSNLAAANRYFETIAKDDSFKVIVPNQLYFKISQQGQKGELTGNERIRIGYAIEDLEGNILFANCDTWINPSQTISGFAHGVQGMRVGEQRTLYIHPALGYGALTTLSPCSGLIIKVCLIDLDAKTSRLLPPLTPLDMSWTQEPALIAEIESSLQQQPRYLGFLYRSMLDQVEGLDQLEIVAELKELVQFPSAIAKSLESSQSKISE
jgi:peptidylprolyl isomerase